ncbi:MAG: polyphosphate:AMP phosphotransferase [Pseudomonadota bacterium]|nr:polyphosphate:AMP phosphotransferase [Pseudomonadota bacterium]MDP1902983.1 polyphosphate:AMP phosphotransferase [Pseudomonadota bacterium]MDP2352245.1 polyphosphate:AMP phosphotransferase [Pseudomonadota bacterium]
MFESAEIGHKVDKETYEQELPALREALLLAQDELVRKRGFQVIIIISGVDGGGRRESVHLLNEWLDTRGIETHGMGTPSDEELDRPSMWRFWRALPPRGKIGIFQGSWYSMPIIDRVYGKTRKVDLEEAMERNVRFEKMLSDEGALILKFWFHLSKDFQKSRLKALEKDPRTRWRVTERDWHHFSLYGKFRKTSAEALRLSSTAQAPWYIIEGSDERYRGLMLGKIVLEAMRMRLSSEHGEPHSIPSLPKLPRVDNLHILKSLDLEQKLSKAKFSSLLETYQGRLNVLTRDPRFSKISVVAVFEGNDAAGKGGSIRRVTGSLDARMYQVIPIAAPTDEEKAQPYLWRFWRHISRRGRMAIFDRSWYGRVLVERVEGYCSEYDWLRAYNEINEFEAQLNDHNIVVVKFWLSISSDEQLRRFKEREKTGFKHYKITDEDWRNRDRWSDYEQAVCDMVDRTSTEHAPWTLVAANNKYHARIQVLKTLCDSIEAGLARVKGKGKAD